MAHGIRLCEMTSSAKYNLPGPSFLWQDFGGAELLINSMFVDSFDEREFRWASAKYEGHSSTAKMTPQGTEAPSRSLLF